MDFEARSDPYRTFGCTVVRLIALAEQQLEHGGHGGHGARLSALGGRRHEPGFLRTAPGRPARHLSSAVYSVAPIGITRRSGFRAVRDFALFGIWRLSQ